MAVGKCNREEDANLEAGPRSRRASHACCGTRRVQLRTNSMAISSAWDFERCVRKHASAWHAAPRHLGTACARGIKHHLFVRPISAPWPEARPLVLCIWHASPSALLHHARAVNLHPWSGPTCLSTLFSAALRIQHCAGPTCAGREPNGAAAAGVGPESKYACSTLHF